MTNKEWWDDYEEAMARDRMQDERVLPLEMYKETARVMRELVRKLGRKGQVRDAEECAKRYWEYSQVLRQVRSLE